MANKKQKSKKTIFQQHPQIVSYFYLKDGKLVFDINDKQILLPEMIAVLSTLTTEYISEIATTVRKELENRGNQNA